MNDEAVTFIAGIAASALIGGLALMVAVGVLGGHVGYLHAVTAWVLLRPVFVPVVRIGMVDHGDPGECTACAHG